VDEPKGSPPPLPPSIAAAFEALTKEASDAPPAAAPPSRSRRPLLDIFPSESASSSRPGRIQGRRAAVPPAVRAAQPAPPPPVDTPERFYGLREPPFAASTDPRFFFRSRSHERVSQQLLTAIRQREGLVVITGAIGTGKTMVCRLVMEELDRRTLTSLVADPSVSGEELLTTILCDFGVLSRDEVSQRPLATRHELSTTLQSFVESLSPLDATAVIIVDDAHRLTGDVLEQIRLLCEAADATSLLQVVLVGQPELTSMLRRPGFRPLHKRVTVRGTLEPLAADEIDGYVRHRIAAAGDAPYVELDASAVARLFEISRGVPQTVNQVCERALAHGHSASAAVITEEIIDAAAADFDLAPSPAFSGLGWRIAMAAALALFVVAGAAAAAWVFRDALTRTIQQWQGAPQPPESPR
jgi:general secretion pathway protein A